MDDKSLQNKHSTLLKRQKLLLNEKLIFTHYFNRVSEEEKNRSYAFEDYMKERMKDEKKNKFIRYREEVRRGTLGAPKRTYEVGKFRKKKR